MKFLMNENEFIYIYVFIVRCAVIYADGHNGFSRNESATATDKITSSLADIIDVLLICVSFDYFC